MRNKKCQKKTKQGTEMVECREAQCATGESQNQKGVVSQRSDKRKFLASFHREDWFFAQLSEKKSQSPQNQLGREDGRK